MPTHVGPNISGEENLVFGFDLSDQKNSYLGEPTTNYFASFGIAMANLSGGNVTTTLPDGTTGMVFRVTVNSNSNTSRCSMGINLSNQIPQANVSYTVSHWIRTTTSVPVAAGWEAEVSFPDGYARPSFESGYIGDYGSLVQPNNISSTWQRVSYTYSYSTTKTSNITPFIYFGSPIGGTQDTIGATIDFYGFQFEVNSHSTPYTTTSRSSTQGLLDLAKNNTINISGVSFNSSAQLVFDGTDDQITLLNPTQIIPNTSNFTIDMVIKSDTTDRMWYVSGYNGGAGPGYYAIGSQDGYFMYDMKTSTGGRQENTGFVTMNVGRIYHIIATRDISGLKIYVNGILQTTNSTVSTYNMNETTIRFGNEYGVRQYLNGAIYYYKHYNRSLSSSEVLNNYNNIKRKYGI